MQASDGAHAASAQKSSEGAADLSTSQLRLQRILKVVVAMLAILLFAGLMAVVWRVIYLASYPATQPSLVATQPAAPSRAIRPQQTLRLPAGAKVRSISLSGNRVAVHYQVGEKAGIAVFDLQTGRMVTDLAVEAKATAAP